jgi:hypothetical protein
MTTESPSRDESRQLLRHTVATLAYRGGKALRGAPGNFGEFSIAQTTRTPLQILAHLGDLFDWALSLAKGKETWNNSTPLPWDKEVKRFFGTLQAFEDYLVSNLTLHTPPEKLFQGPVADALSHVGQIAMLRRVAASPIRGENYLRAEIVAGRVGPEQTAPRREFD